MQDTILIILHYANIVAASALITLVLLTWIIYLSDELATIINIFTHWMDSRK